MKVHVRPFDKGFAALLLGCAGIALLLSLAGSPIRGEPPARSQKPDNKIRNLYDAFGHQKKVTILEWGYSTLIEYNGKTILFDGGSDADTLAHNARALGVDLRKVDLAVLSHRHADHASGLGFLLKVNPGVTLLPRHR